MRKASVIFERDMRKWLRNRRNLIYAIGLPLGMLFIGFSFQSLFINSNLFGNYDYIHLFGTAIPVIVSFMAAYQVAGMTIVREKDNNTWERYFVTPISKSDFVIGTITSCVTRTLISSILAYIIVIFLVGFDNIGIHNFLSGLLLLVISVVGWVGFSVMLAINVNYNTYYSIGIFSNILIFTSSGWISPVENLPLWLKIISYINPLTHSINGLRDIILQRQSIIFIGLIFLFLLIFSILMIVIGILLLKRKID